MPTASYCPELRALSEFLLGQLPYKETQRTAHHLTSCSSCLALVQKLRGGSSKTPPTLAAREEIVRAILANLGGPPSSGPTNPVPGTIAYEPQPREARENGLPQPTPITVPAIASPRIFAWSGSIPDPSAPTATSRCSRRAQGVV